MNLSPALRKLLIGAAMSAVSAASGLIVGLPAVDPEHFNVDTFGGWKHLGYAIFWVVIFAEVRFVKAWADEIKARYFNGNGQTKT